MSISSFVSLRIIGQLNIEELSHKLNLQPSNTHKKGEKDKIGRPFDTDLWSFRVQSNPGESLREQLELLVDTFEGKYKAIEEIKSRAKIDVFCSVTSTEQGGFSLSPKGLSIFQDLEINMEVSLILKDRD